MEQMMWMTDILALNILKNGLTYLLTAMALTLLRLSLFIIL